MLTLEEAHQNEELTRTRATLTDENRAHIKTWCEDLRSGKYEQGEMALHDQGKFCCLGVACDRYSQDTGIGGWEPINKASYDATKHPSEKTFMVFRIAKEEDPVEREYLAHSSFYQDAMTLPGPVAEWLLGDVNALNPSAIFPNNKQGDGYIFDGLASANDQGVGFSEIADAIERTFL